MTEESETLGGLALGGLSSKQKADLSGHPCRNCGAPVSGRYCEVCGQLAASFHRPVWSLIGETIGDTLALDGRISRTIPLLFFRPGRLTVNYSSGSRARYVPPFRLFLLASLVFFFTVFAFVGNAGWIDELKLTSANQERAAGTGGEVVSVFDEDGKVDRDAAKDILAEGEPLPADAEAAIDQAFDIVDDPRLFLAGLEKWAPRLSLLLVPSTILILALLHFWRRRLFIYHHAIHALHLHTWLYLSTTLFLILLPVAGGWLGYLYGVLIIFYLARSLMVVGETGLIMAGLRTIILLISWVFLIGFATIAATVLSAIQV